MSRFTRTAAAIFAGFFVLAACTTMPSSSSSPDLNGTAWVLSSLPGHALQPDSAATLRFEGGRLQGTDGCNRYSAPYTLTGSALQVGPRGASTQMACPPAVMMQAELFMNALTRATAYRVVEGQLQLQTADGAVVATFARQSQTLAGTSWRATAINNGKGAVVSVVRDSAVTMSFADDGKASGSAGCNRYTASYRADRNALRFSSAAATRKFCPAPGLMEQEQQLFDALESVATMRLEGDRLEMRTEQGALALTLTRSAGH